MATFADNFVTFFAQARQNYHQSMEAERSRAHQRRMQREQMEQQQGQFEATQDRLNDQLELLDQHQQWQRQQAEEEFDYNTETFKVADPKTGQITEMSRGAYESYKAQRLVDPLKTITAEEDAALGAFGAGYEPGDRVTQSRYDSMLQASRADERARQAIAQQGRQVNAALSQFEWQKDRYEEEQGRQGAASLAASEAGRYLTGDFDTTPDTPNLFTAARDWLGRKTAFGTRAIRSGNVQDLAAPQAMQSLLSTYKETTGRQNLTPQDYEAIQAMPEAAVLRERMLEEYRTILDAPSAYDDPRRLRRTYDDLSMQLFRAPASTLLEIAQTRAQGVPEQE